MNELGTDCVINVCTLVAANQMAANRRIIHLHLWTYQIWASFTTGRKKSIFQWLSYSIV